MPQMGASRATRLSFSITAKLKDQLVGTAPTYKPIGCQQTTITIEHGTSTQGLLVESQEKSFRPWENGNVIG